MITQNPQLVMLPTLLLKNETDPGQLPVMLVDLSTDTIQLTKHTPIGFPQLYTDFHKSQITEREIN